MAEEDKTPFDEQLPEEESNPAEEEDATLQDEDGLEEEDSLVDDGTYLADKAEEGVQHAKSDTKLERGGKLRRELVKRLPNIEYPDSISTDRMDLKSWLGPIIDLDSRKFLNVLNRLLPKNK